MRDSQPQDFTERVHLFLDREMHQEDAQTFLQEISENAHQKNALDEERNFRNMVKNGVHRRKASSDLIQSIKEKIRVVPA